MKIFGVVATLMVFVVCGLLGCSSKKEEPRTADLQESEEGFCSDSTKTEEPKDSTSVPQWVKSLNDIPLPEYMKGDSLTDVYFKYNQEVNGYEVTARWRVFQMYSETGRVVMRFHDVKTEKDYVYYSDAGNVYNSYDTDQVSFAEDFKGHHQGDVYYFDYSHPDLTDPYKDANGDSPLDYYKSFQFLDVDFDNHAELLVSDWNRGHGGNEYTVFKLTDHGLEKLDYIPLDRLMNSDKIDKEKKTITIVSEDGAFDSAEFFFSRKTRRHKIVNLPKFHSFSAASFDFKKYNRETGCPFVLDSIREYQKSDTVYQVLYEIKESGQIVRKD